MARLMTGLNDLATVNPDLAAEWHPTKNAPLLPSQVTGGSSKKVWWLGKCGHEWEAVISKRSGRGDGCPLCRKSRPKTHEEFCKSINKINPFIEITGTYVKSNVRVSVRCKKCGFEWSTNQIRYNKVAVVQDALKQEHRDRNNTFVFLWNKYSESNLF